MRAGKRQPPVRRAGFGKDGSTEEFCEFDQLVDRVGLDHAAAGENGRILCCCQDGSRPFQFVNWRPHERIQRLRRRQIKIAHFALHVNGNGKKHRTGRRHECGLDGPSNGQRQIGCPFDFDSPLRPRLRDGNHVRPKDRFLEFQPPVLLAGGEDQRRSRAIGVVKHAHRVAQTATDVDIHNTRRSRRCT